jgi:hypothetical protein
MDSKTLDLLKSESELMRDVVKELQRKISLTGHAIELEQVNIDLEKDILKSKMKAKTIDKDEYDLAKKILRYRTSINDQISAGNVPQKRMIKSLMDAEQKYAALKKNQQESTSEQEQFNQSLSRVADKAGLGSIVGYSKELAGLWKSHPMLAALALTLDFSRLVLGVFKNIDNAAAEFRMQMGMTKDATKDVYGMAKELTMNLMQVGVSAKVANASLIEVSKNLFSSQNASYDLVENISLMSAQLGVSATTSSNFLKSMSMISGTTAQAQINMSYFTQRLTEAAGVPLGDVMEDINKAAKGSYQFVAKTGLALIKAAVDARRMGTSIESSTKSSSSLLNFTQSVKDEMEASVLLGKSINLQKARELAYSRNIKGLNVEIMNILNNTDFEHLDPFQQETLAKALGKQSGELAEMLAAQKQNQALERSSDKNVQSKLKAYKELVKMTETQAKESGKDLLNQIRIKQNQATLAAISQTWSSIIQKLSEDFLPAILWTLNKIQDVLNYLSKNPTLTKILGLVGTITLLAVVFKSMKSLTGLLGKAGGGMSKAGGGMIGNFIGGLGDGLKKLSLTGILKGALALAALGASLWLFAKLSKPFTELNWKGMLTATLALAAVALVAGIMGAPPIVGFLLMGAVAIAALGLALLPFAAAAWIASKALQNLSDVPLLQIAGGLAVLGAASPLVIAAGIGLGAAAPGLFMFGLALRVLSGPAEKVGMAMQNLGLGIKMTVDSLIALKGIGFVGTISQIKDLASVIKELSKAINDMPDIKVEKLNGLLNQNKSRTQNNATKSNDDVLIQIKDAIDALRTDMKNGSLTANVYIDSQKLDALMGRRLAYTGQLT